MLLQDLQKIRSYKTPICFTYKAPQSMSPSNPNRTSLITTQVLSIMLQNRPFDTALASQTKPILLTTETIIDIFRQIPRFFFQSPRSIGRQKTTRHRFPLKQRNLNLENRTKKSLGPAAYRDPIKVNRGLNKAMEFFYWLETEFHFVHNEFTVKEMARVLAKSNKLQKLWQFLREMSIRDNSSEIKVVSIDTITCLIKVLGEEGLVNEALTLFYRMKQYHFKPDVYAYNTMIYALCRIGNFKKARFLFEQMELPGFRCPPDTYTYTIMISSYCKYCLQTGCRKAIRRRLWEANHLFRIMLFKGFMPDVVTYNCLIDGCCKSYRIERALELFEDMSKRGCVPNSVTYNSFIRYYSAVNEIDKAIEMLRKMQSLDHGVATSSSYTPIIHALCEAGRVLEARDFFVELVDGGTIPREYTFKLVCDALESVGNGGLLDAEYRERIKNGIGYRFRQVKKVKPIMARKMIL